MIAGIRLVPLFLRRGNRGDDLVALGLTAVGVAVAVMLTLVALSLRPGFDARDDRMAWREPTAASDADATALQVRSTELFDHHAIDRVDLAPTATAATATARSARAGPAGATRTTGTADADGTGATTGAGGKAADETAGTGLPGPPGMERFPRPGEVYVSPALGRLLDDAGAEGESLAERFGGTVAGTIGAGGLAHEDELVVVVGHGAGELAADPAGERTTPSGRLPGDPSAVTPIDGFATSGNHPSLETYRITAALGSVLLVVPALLLIGSAARLTAARRSQRLAALRLAGATPGAVVALSAAETATAAFAGTVAGIGLYAAALPVVAHAAVAGGPWAIGDLWLGWPALLLTLVVTPLLAAVCAAVALRQVVISPLGVARRVGGRAPRAIRLVGMAAAWAVLAVAAGEIGSGSTSDEVLVPIIVGLGLVIGSLALVGPWITWILGALVTRLARRPTTLLAGRRILDDPKAAYRAVSGVVLAGMTAGFLFTLGPIIQSLDGRDRNDPDLIATVTTSDPAILEQDLAARIEDAGLDATATVDAPPPDNSPTTWADVTVTPAPGTDPEQVRTALAGALDRQPLEAAGDDLAGDEMIVSDFRGASLALAVATMVLAATTTAVTSSASILDQRPTLRRLRLGGTPLRTLQRARVWQAALPLVVATVGSLATGVGTALLLLTAAGNENIGAIGPDDLAPMLVVVAAGLALVLAAGALTRPLLVAATTDPLADA